MACHTTAVAIPPPMESGAAVGAITVLFSVVVDLIGVVELLNGVGPAVKVRESGRFGLVTVDDPLKVTETDAPADALVASTFRVNPASTLVKLLPAFRCV